MSDTTRDALVDSSGDRMLAATFPGDSTVALDWRPVPTPGPGQLVIETGASAICASDLRNAYHGWLDRGERSYTGCIGGHEFAGRIVLTGPGVRDLRPGQLVMVYHVAGCGQCEVCRTGYLIHCRSPYRRAHGNQRDGGHAPYVLVDAVTAVAAPDGFSATDASLLGCGFGTAYEGLNMIDMTGRDEVLVVGLGPVGLASAMVARGLGARRVVGAETSQGRRIWAERLGLFDAVTDPADVPYNAFTASVDASGAASGRLLAVRALRSWGRCAFLGEGGDITLDVSADLLHKQVTLTGSWVTSVPNMAKCARLLASRGMHPEAVVEHRLPLREADYAYKLAVDRSTGKVCLVFGDAPADADR